MKRIVIDVRESGTSTGRYVDKFIEHLYKLRPDYKITLLAKTHRLEYLRGIAPGYDVIETPFAYFTFGEQLGFKKQIEQLKPDLVHFTMTQQPILYRGKVVTTMHDLTRIRFNNPAKNPVVFVIKQQVYKWVTKKSAKKSDAVITPTNFVKDDIVNYTHIDPAKVAVTYEASDPIKNSPEPLQQLNGKDFIMYVGSPHIHKNLENLILAYAKMKTSHPTLKLALMGKRDSNYERIENFAKEHDIENVVFTDFVSDGQLRWAYEHCLAYIFPSLSEGFGLPPLEAMIHGAPVVSSNASCLPEVYGDAAYYFNPLDTNDMATKISDVLDNDELRKSLIDQGSEQVKKYSWDRMTKQTLEVYERVLSSR
jgi:glycosyltransferase involved in cell wall biosynthesis